MRYLVVISNVGCNEEAYIKKEDISIIAIVELTGQ